MLCMQAAWTPHKKKVDATEVTKAPMHSVLASSRKTAGYIRSHKIKLQALKFRTMGRLFKGHYTPLVGYRALGWRGWDNAR